MTKTLDELEAIANTATPGPWTTAKYVGRNDDWFIRGPGDQKVTTGPGISGANARLISAANPETVKSLISAARERDALKDENERLRDALEYFLNASIHINELGMKQGWDNAQITNFLRGAERKARAALEGEGV